MTLSDRERFILHAMSVVTIDQVVKKVKEDPDILEKLDPMSEEDLSNEFIMIRKGRCRKMTVNEIISLFDEMKEEMMIGKEIHKQ